MRGIARLIGYRFPTESCVPVNVALGKILHITEIQEKHWPKEYGKLYPTDIQFQLCEYDKYERVLYNQGRPRSKYKPR
jgi:hypothetical protein